MYSNTFSPYNRHSNLPSSGINTYNFALYPEQHQPSGSYNHSIIDQAIINFTVDPIFNHVTVTPKINDNIQKLINDKKYELLFKNLNINELKINMPSDEICAICSNEVHKADHILKIKDCSHMYCIECILTWKYTFEKNTCPTCRHDITGFIKCITD